MVLGLIYYCIIPYTQGWFTYMAPIHNVSSGENMIHTVLPALSR